jgi:MFS family permease
MESPVSVQPVAIHDSVLSPLREPLFRSLWIAAVISYTGGWMQNVATGWLMTSLTSSPMWVALVQVAVSLPVLLIALPAGALADIFDRRKFLLFTQASMVAAATVLGIMTLTGTVTPQILLVFTFLLGVGAVMNDPAWQALTPDLVPPNQLASAVALNSAGFNIARAIGPALGGLLIAAICCGTTGSGWAFLLNAVSFFGVILFLYHWKPAQAKPRNGTATFMGEIGIGLRYARRDPRAGAHAAVFHFCQRVLGIASFDRQQVWRSRLWRDAGILWTGRARRCGSSCRREAAALAGCSHRLRNVSFCHCALWAGAFAFARGRIGIFRGSRVGMDQYSRDVEPRRTDGRSALGSGARNFNVRAGSARRIGFGQRGLGSCGVQRGSALHAYFRGHCPYCRLAALAVVSFTAIHQRINERKRRTT